MAEETDGIEEAFEGQLRVLVTAAGQIAERMASPGIPWQRQSLTDLKEEKVT